MAARLTSEQKQAVVDDFIAGATYDDVTNKHGISASTAARLKAVAKTQKRKPAKPKGRKRSPPAALPAVDERAHVPRDVELELSRLREANRRLQAFLRTALELDA